MYFMHVDLSLDFDHGVWDAAHYYLSMAFLMFGFLDDCSFIPVLLETVIYSEHKPWGW